MDYKDGDTITVNGKPCRIEGGSLVPVESMRGPLGGELVSLAKAPCNAPVYGRFLKEQDDESGLYRIITPNGISAVYSQSDIDQEVGAFYETNIPPRPTFTPMSAGEAAKLPDIVGRWVAVQVEKTDGYEVVLGDEKYERWFDGDDQILLIEGVDLP